MRFGTRLCERSMEISEMRVEVRMPIRMTRTYSHAVPTDAVSDLAENTVETALELKS
jgi:hypothetical protein